MTRPTPGLTAALANIEAAQPTAAEMCAHSNIALWLVRAAEKRNAQETGR